MNGTWQSRITMEPGKRGGRSCIRGMRITVYDVLSYLAAGMTVAEILDDFPYLTQEDIQACLAYAAERERRMTLWHEQVIQNYDRQATHAAKAHIVGDE